MREDLTGRVFGSWTVLGYVSSDKSRDSLWLCRCVCGTERAVSRHSLVRGRSKNCAERTCRPNFKNLVGHRFGSGCVVLALSGFDRWSHSVWLCRCRCGREWLVSGGNIASGNANSCGLGECWYSWKGGVTPLYQVIRMSSKYKAWRTQVFQRDNYTCQMCGEKKSGHLVVDHVYPFSWILEDHEITTMEQALQCAHLWDIWNGRTLCEDCHKKTETYANKAKRKRAWQ